MVDLKHLLLGSLLLILVLTIFSISNYAYSEKKTVTPRPTNTSNTTVPNSSLKSEDINVSKSTSNIISNGTLSDENQKVHDISEATKPKETTETKIEPPKSQVPKPKTKNVIKNDQKDEVSDSESLDPFQKELSKRLKTKDFGLKKTEKVEKPFVKKTDSQLEFRNKFQKIKSKINEKVALGQTVGPNIKYGVDLGKVVDQNSIQPEIRKEDEVKAAVISPVNAENPSDTEAVETEAVSVDNIKLETDQPINPNLTDLDMPDLNFIAT